MRSDKGLEKSLRNDVAWDKDQITGKSVKELKRFAIPSLERSKMSFSGHERNHLFLNRAGDSFDDMSGISGLNTDSDSRSFAVLDFDRDGWQDIVLASITSPVISFYRNQMGAIEANAKNRMLLVDCIGGNNTAGASTQYGCRDGYGAKVKVTLGDQILVREKRCGEGLAAQNSQLLHFGLGSVGSTREIQVQWPSGVVQQIENVPAGSLVRVFENASQSKNSNGIEVSKLPAATALKRETQSNQSLEFHPQVTGSAKVKAKHRMFVSMATWCANCKKQIPQLQLLRSQFSDSELQMIGVPIDGGDTEAKLSKYLEQNNPPYELSGSWASGDREKFRQLIKQNLEADSLPATIVTDNKGRVLDIFNGVATVSQLSEYGLSDDVAGQNQPNE